MSQLRVETVSHLNSGMVHAELYYPENELLPIATTEPIYQNREEAVKQSCVMFECWMSQIAEELEE